MARDKDPPFSLRVDMTEGRKSNHFFHTVKSARHYVKVIVNNVNVAKITLNGDGAAQVMFDAKELGV